MDCGAEWHSNICHQVFLCRSPSAGVIRLLPFLHPPCILFPLSDFKLWRHERSPASMQIVTRHPSFVICAEVKLCLQVVQSSLPAHFKKMLPLLWADDKVPPLTCSLFPAEIQHCLVSAGDVGCGVFECFENNSCEIRGLQEICMTFLHNAGKFDSQVLSWSLCLLKWCNQRQHSFSFSLLHCSTLIIYIPQNMSVLLFFWEVHLLIDSPNDLFSFLGKWICLYVDWCVYR